VFKSALYILYMTASLIMTSMMTTVVFIRSPGVTFIRPHIING